MAKHALIVFLLGITFSPAFASITKSGKKDATTNLNNVVMSQDKLAPILAALPKVSYAPLQQVFTSPLTIWYDATTITPSYQKSTGGSGFWGANANSDWINGIPSDPDLQAEGRLLVDPARGRWQFPFGATAGADDATNMVTANFLALPPAASGGGITPLVLSSVEDDSVEAGMRTWVWTYPQGTIVGEVVFINDGNGGILPCEVRMRTKNAGGWSVDVFRPFPHATDLDAAVKQLRPNWAQTPSLVTLTQYLENTTTLTPKSLAAVKFTGTFSQDGFIDVLPDFGDATLAHDLLTSTVFSSAYGAIWKQNGTQVTYAASTNSLLSIVPNNYYAGIIEVSDASCTRCHTNTATLIDHWTDSLVLYGEVWGKDGVFTFHPFDESYYPDLALEGTDDNRHMNPKLQNAGVITWGGATIKSKKTKVSSK